ncbi:hypothetical protein GLYMA_03G183000v4 [Glycine max]|uniref:Uncharacterized protein n=2 Tax=Glycine subgen. Soja TaxID=1462606 RepID=K7KFT7_SOYBN|nr:auxin-responsive protein SAUR32 [Glycine max]XP_028223822.1 auxin-responsive protein SAUR32-like [Glycine soja]KAG5043779.1 hypothetical protein JHK87_007694 [Glycine soja]KAG5055569.1 hypothetical protein JHK85_008079 [Glycine max]KAG5072632.1 hypothetical protein JHK86_007843 [Glycine max]KAH1070643.1 hypothetical protein GYH30_007622 [Glycine max]KRH67723.1 hypothetical protein GLYMA_03G183000v4 [Glycine max]|eukprot:XP_003520653.2 auxin-responsive protein SAUR32 [Glycine max]
MLGSCVKKLQKSVSLLFVHSNEDQLEAAATLVPEDVMEGHFAVLAIKGEETRRFVVKLDYLADPMFMELLNQAREEYGFKQKGALAVPCRPQELQNVLDGPRAKAERSFVDGSDMFHLPNVLRPLSRSKFLHGIMSFINIRLYIKKIIYLSKK